METKADRKPLTVLILGERLSPTREAEIDRKFREFLRDGEARRLRNLAAEMNHR